MGFRARSRHALLIGLFCWCAIPVMAAPQDSRPRILVTNDDGYASDGIRAVAEALSVFADIVVIAPVENLSGASQSTHVFRPPYEILVREVSISENIKGYSITGTPADAVYTGIKLYGGQRGFDLVVSGINAGPNFGEGYYHSGTVGAAFQAASQGVAGIAISQANKRPEHVTAADFAARLARALLAEPLPEGIIVSVNVPNGEIRGAVAAPPGTGPYSLEFIATENAEGEPAYLPKLIVDEEDPEHDIKVFREGYISVTPLRLDRSHPESLKQLAALDFISLPAD